MNETVKTAVICSLGGFCAWLLAELPHRLCSCIPMTLGALVTSGVFFGIVGSVLAVTISASEGIMLLSLTRARQGVRFAAIAGGLLGMGAGVGVEVFYQWTAEARTQYTLLQWLFRGTAWAGAGMGAGVAAGLTKGPVVRVFRGLFGGATGGLAGGLLFDPINAVIQGGAVSRCVGLVILGLCVGLSIRAVERLSRRTWLVIVQGRSQGKEFALDKAETVLGSNELVDVFLPGDRSVLGRHARLTRHEDQSWLESVEGPIEADGRQGARLQLRDGSLLKLGEYGLIFRERVS